MGKTTDDHKKSAPAEITAAVITVSDSLFDPEKSKGRRDVSGEYIAKALEDAGHKVVFYEVVPDDETSIVGTIKRSIKIHSPDVVITAGGTGVAIRDVTIEAVSGMLDKVLDGFGEFFRKESCEKLGSAAFLTRATAGVYGGTVIFSLPGSPDAARTGMNIILREICHIVKHVRE